MKALGKFLLFVPVFLLMFISCSDSSDPPPEDVLVKVGDFPISDLAGDWVATSARFSDNTYNVEIVGEGGSVNITIQSNGRFTLTITPPERPSYTVSGEMFWEEWEGDYYFSIVWDNYPNDWDSYGATLSGNTFTINGGFDTGEYDFDNNGTFESCSIAFTFVRD